ncbi:MULTISPECIES: hypothetical protein [unclassified Janthinobacterium]|uniref:hypothetical protein n=1 Tax=unclassified Janthinobacterium TaxID=2610881 RepID=UPI0013053341|nr:MULTISPECIES: hypothetical protein [unclassified Janthinobacterium]MDZ5633994.1 hypothetical protein [Janthinobacterium sp. GMG1]
MNKILIWIVVACSISSMFMVSFVCYTYWPDKDSSLPSWVQAVGAILAILAAGGGLAWQARKQDEAEQNRRKNELLNMLRALHTEAKSYEKMLKAFEGTFAQNFALQLTGRLQTVFPSIEPTFAIYHACAPLLGAIASEELRDDIVVFYAEMALFFAALNRNSTHAALIPHDAAPSSDIADALAQMGPQLETQLKDLLTIAARLNIAIPAVIGSRP